MFKRTRIKIMIFITTTVMLLLAGTVGAISLSSYIEEYNQTVGPNANGLIEMFEYSELSPESVIYDTEYEDGMEKEADSQDKELQDGAVVGKKASQDEINMQLSVIKRFVGVLIRNTFKVGIVIVIIVFILSYFIAGWILKPLEESYKKQKQFISDAGHELKTPVAAIDANAELLYGDIGDNKWLQSIRYESRRMTELIRQMLDLARTENVEVEKEKLDMSRLVMGSVLPYEGVAFEKGYEIETDIEEDVFYTGNRGQMEQLLAILVDNAIDHASGEGRIGISLHKEGSNIILNVSNSGEAISSEDAKNLFERFYRADKAHTDNGHYGLGLAIAKAIVTSNKGHIDVMSKDGSNFFTVKL
ncbi:MAG: HAMP domain-containing histidine kinase [Butyrivibrio sp.]|jgi:signal transduction histidine kinase|nr:HAMP domain-containing histidine kinase [Butyrivibrio sp.]